VVGRANPGMSMPSGMLSCNLNAGYAEWQQ
jgi:hypothetical protein